MAPQTFRTIFCEEFRCADSDYKELAFKKCLYWHAKLVAPLLRAVNSEFFAKDFELFEILGGMAHWHEVKMELVEFQDSNRFGGFLRKHLRIRISGRKAQILASRLLRSHP